MEIRSFGGFVSLRRCKAGIGLEAFRISEVLGRAGIKIRDRLTDHPPFAASWHEKYIYSSTPVEAREHHANPT